MTAILGSYRWAPGMTPLAVLYDGATSAKTGTPRLLTFVLHLEPHKNPLANVRRLRCRSPFTGAIS